MLASHETLRGVIRSLALSRVVLYDLYYYRRGAEAAGLYHGRRGGDQGEAGGAAEAGGDRRGAAGVRSPRR